jgi:peptidoglycan/xylan/chitin deacetylase (PgdA/CDA1 family)
MKKITRYLTVYILLILLLLAGCRTGAMIGSSPETGGTTLPALPSSQGTRPSTAKPGPVTTVPLPSTTVPLPSTTVPYPSVTTEPTTLPVPTTQPRKNYTLELILLGEEEITLEYGSEYSDAGAEVKLLCDGMPVPQHQIPEIFVEDPVDTGRTGSYTITYLVAFDTGSELLSESIQRVVHVVDTQAPVITLISDPDTYTYPGHSYVEEGYTAIDGYDGDITDRVERTEENGTVTYRVSDMAGNETVITRSIRYDDPVAPELTLKGESIVVIKVGKDFEEPGCEALDDCDGDLTGQIQTEGTVNKWLAGTYVITYYVQDGAGNIATAQRTVVVEPVNNGKVIYLTFDDGPSQHTPRLLDILDKYQVKATFFVVNTYYVKYIEDIVERGHTIGVHSATHEFSQIYSSEEAFFADLEKMRNIIYKRTGVYTNLIRFAGGSSNTISKFNPGIMTRLTKLVGEKGYHYFDWNVESGDAGRVTTAEAVLENVIKGCKNKKTSIVLQHDSKGYSVDAVEQIIQWGLENGYTFLTLNENSPKSHHAIVN